MVYKILLLNLFFICNKALASFPDNSLDIPLHNKSYTGISEFDVNTIAENLKMVIGPSVFLKLSKEIKFELYIEESKVDVNTTRDDDDNPVIRIYGGLVRHPQLSVDGLSLLLCHEIGHHMGGAPRKFRGKSQLRSWSSAEGQADYYATSKCLRRLFYQFADFKSFRKFHSAKEILAAGNVCENDICQRIILAGLNVSKLFANLKKVSNGPNITFSSDVRVDKTFFKHPRPQCRLDTYSAGARCVISSNIEFDRDDPKVGACLFDTHSIGPRPKCWFSAKNF